MRKGTLLIGLMILWSCSGGYTPPGDVQDPGDLPGSSDVRDAMKTEIPQGCVTADDCPEPDGECGRAICTVDGFCAVEADPGREGALCDTDDLCALEPGRCSEGVCEYGLRRACPGGPCTRGVCDPATGDCSLVSDREGSACEADGNACTGDLCRDGECVAGPNSCACTRDSDCPLPPDRCHAMLTCDTAEGECVPVAEGGKSCVQPEDPCRIARCDGATGECVSGDAPDGLGCAPSDVCNHAGYCLGGGCVVRARCQDDNPCTRDTCDPLNGACSFPSLANTLCDDGDSCTVDDRCKEGVCAGFPKECRDENPCTLDYCDQELGCISRPLAKGDGCDPGDGCVLDATCDGGGRCQGKPKSCDDQNQCTHDSCNPSDGQCINVAIDGACDHDVACRGPGRCEDGQCVPGEALFGCCVSDGDCDDQDACTVDRCVNNACVTVQGAGRSCVDDSTGCQTGWCLPDTGQCRIVDESRPQRLIDWHLDSGDPVPGFRWTRPQGDRDESGVGPLGSAISTGFRLPRKWAAGGVRVLAVHLSEGGCPDADLMVRGEPVGTRGCGTQDGRTVRTWAWNEVAGELDVEVVVHAGGRVARLELVAWAAPDCRPIQPIRVVAGTSLSHPAVSGDSDGVRVAYMDETTVRVGGWDVDAGVQVPWTVRQESVGSDFKWFRTALSHISSGTHFLAWGGVDAEVRTAVLRKNALVRGAASLPFTESPGGPGAYQPAVLARRDGTFLTAWAYPPEFPVQDLDVAAAAGVLTGEGLSWGLSAYRVNDGTYGYQSLVALAPSGQGAVAAWVSRVASGESETYMVMARLVAASGQAFGATYQSPLTVTPIRDLSLAVHDSRAYILWEEGEGTAAGVVLDAATLQTHANLQIAQHASFPRYRPRLVANGGGVLASWVVHDSVRSRTWIHTSRVDPEGTTSLLQEAYGPLERLSADFSAAPYGPFLVTWAVVDTLHATERGIRIGFAAQACDRGLVDCSDPLFPRVCVGFADSPYLAVPGADSWCP